MGNGASGKEEASAGSSNLKALRGYSTDKLAGREGREVRQQAPQANGETSAQLWETANAPKSRFVNSPVYIRLLATSPAVQVQY